MSHPNVFVSDQLRNFVYVYSSLCQLGTEAMPQIMELEIFNLSLSYSIIKSPSEIIEEDTNLGFFATKDSVNVAKGTIGDIYNDNNKTLAAYEFEKYGNVIQ